MRISDWSSDVCSSDLLLLALLPSAAHAHSFGRIYNLPVPFWMYAYGATAALLLSFLVFGYFVSAGHAQTDRPPRDVTRSEEHTSELQSLMRISYAVFCLKKKTTAN